MKKLAKCKKPAKNSLRWFKEEWVKMAGKLGGKLPKAFIEGLAQLSYSQKRIFERLDAIEKLQATTDGRLDDLEKLQFIEITLPLVGDSETEEKERWS
jgi:hypothetical protein